MACFNVRIVATRPLKLAQTVAVAFLFLLSLVVNEANAQVSLNPSIPDGVQQWAVCSFGGGGRLNIADDDDCEGGTTLFPTTGLTIGPDGSQIYLNSSNGNATFGAPANFNSTASFNGAMTVNGGVTVSSGIIVSGTQTVNMGGNRIQNVATPTAGTDAANKQYVDDQNAVQQTQINTNTADIATNTTNIAANTANIAANTTDIATNSSDIANLQMQANDANLAISALQGDVTSLQDRDRELAEGIAIALALDAPVLRSGQTFALRGGWGNFDGSNAAGVTAAGAISQNVVVDAGVGWGASQGTVAGKAGLTLGW